MIKGFIEDKEPQTREELLHALREAAQAEYDAINTYTSMIEETNNEDFKKVLKSVLNEETVHVGEFTKLIARLFPEEQGLIDKGMSEADEILGRKIV